MSNLGASAHTKDQVGSLILESKGSDLREAGKTAEASSMRPRGVKRDIGTFDSDRVFSSFRWSLSVLSLPCTHVLLHCDPSPFYFEQRCWGQALVDVAVTWFSYWPFLKCMGEFYVSRLVPSTLSYYFLMV